MVADCRRLPIRKRYLRAGLFSAEQEPSSPLLPPATGPADVMTATAVTPDPIAISCGSLSAAAVKPPPCLRAGVIRHSSNPQRCLAFYYMPKIY
jgi:hypothetical protein